MEVNLANRRISINRTRKVYEFDNNGVSRPVPRGFCLDLFSADFEVSETSGVVAFTIPEEFNGWAFKELTASVHERGDGFKINVINRRAGVDNTVKQITCDNNIWFKAEEFSDTYQLQTGDRIYFDIVDVGNNPPMGLSITVMFKIT